MAAFAKAVHPLIKRQHMISCSENVSVAFKNIAEEILMNKNLETMSCNVPSSAKSTFLVTFSCDRKYAASAHGDHNIYITEISSGKLIYALTGHSRTPWCLVFHPHDNNILASGSLAGEVCLWKLKEQGSYETVHCSKAFAHVASIDLHPTEPLLLIAAFHAIFLWDWQCNELILENNSRFINLPHKLRYVKFVPGFEYVLTGFANYDDSKLRYYREAYFNGAFKLGKPAHFCCTKSDLHEASSKPSFIEYYTALHLLHKHLLAMERIIRLHHTIACEVKGLFRDSLKNSPQCLRNSFEIGFSLIEVIELKYFVGLIDSIFCRLIEHAQHCSSAGHIGPDAGSWQADHQCPKNQEMCLLCTVNENSENSQYSRQLFHATYRIQIWSLQELKYFGFFYDKDNLVVPRCKIHNDASISVSTDGQYVAAFSVEKTFMRQIGIYSLDPKSLGNMMYSCICSPNAVSLSFSPSGKFIVIGFSSSRSNTMHNSQVAVKIYKVPPIIKKYCDKEGNLDLQKELGLKDFNLENDISLNCIRWLPMSGQGFIFGTNKGHLQIVV